jgi:hypothetical protein
LCQARTNNQWLLLNLRYSESCFRMSSLIYLRCYHLGLASCRANGENNFLTSGTGKSILDHTVQRREQVQVLLAKLLHCKVPCEEKLPGSKLLPSKFLSLNVFTVAKLIRSKFRVQICYGFKGLTAQNSDRLKSLRVG